MERAAIRTRRTIGRLKGYRELTDGQIAAALGMSRSKVQSYTGGPTKVTAEMLAAFAAVLDVPDYVLAMEADDALRWVLDNSPNGPRDPAGLGSDRSSCTSHDLVERLRNREVEPMVVAEQAA